MEFKLPWREAGPPNHHDDKVDSDLRPKGALVCEMLLEPFGAALQLLDATVEQGHRHRCVGVAVTRVAQGKAVSTDRLASASA